MMKYDYLNVAEVEKGMDELYKVDKRMFELYTIRELIDDAVTAGLMPVSVGEAYITAYDKGEVCQY